MNLPRLLRRAGSVLTGETREPASAAASASAAALAAEERAVIAEMHGILDRVQPGATGGFAVCCEHFRKETTILAQYRVARGHLRHVPGLAGSRGLDFACWCGFMTWMMRRLGAAEVWGSDVVATHTDAASAWTKACGIAGVGFKANPPDSVPFPTAHFDWTIVSGLYSNLNPAATAAIFAELRRVLKPGGLMLLNDGGNILHAPTLERIRARYHELERGDGSALAPRGIFTAERATLIRGLRPDLNDAAVEAAARDTFGMWRPQIEAYLDGLAEGRAPAPHRFDPTDLHAPPVDPWNGNAAARANDPARLRAELEAAGFTGIRFTRYAGSAAITEAEFAEAMASTPGLFLVAVA